MTGKSRREPPVDGDEVATLTGMLDRHRDTLRWKCAGLTDDQLRQRMAPTDMTLAGLVLHLTMVEASWFNLVFTGGTEKPGWLDVAGGAGGPDVDWAWAHVADFSAEQLWAWFDEAVSFSERIVATTLAGGSADPLATRAAHAAEPVTLRWILVHMIEEYARHNGHADLLRQSIDGAVGD